MIGVSPQLAIRLTLLGVVAVILQVSAVTQIQIVGVNADIVPLTVASVGLLCGSLNGAALGFFAGLFVDMALFQTLGVNSLLLLTVGYLAGRLREMRDPQGAAIPMAVGGAATAIGVGGYALLQFLLGVDAPVSFLLLGQVLLTVVVNVIVAVPVHAFVRRWLLPALPDDPRRRRRRAYTTGGLSPLSRA
ncbi:rod shape-determining protein MreD [Conexibacter sp. W3-3-2]|uniref:Rod shape-determining protein MreD n=1 Tax=Paraconexibacter algicola TaxID=2133960 RepID=A0A2T4UER3_9ACTN|nr:MULTISPECIES: rod shape-determining protein MreD [Solirubrobacterales]MTD42784.1 rod shape-determining protein MreD [Conexibacter sp. W3-3-2]PTL56279.1 rod shape-determining protein MreD [Paraconexibacter algicola]